MSECEVLMAEKRAASIAALEQELIISGRSGTLLTEGRKKVLALTPSELLQELRKGNLTAVLVLEAFQAKAIEETRRTNCVTEFIPAARKWAEDLDSMVKSSSSDASLPLHGLPISVKDNVMVKGHDATLGLHKRVGQSAEADSSIVTVFKKLGAVPFAITNIPQLCISLGCSNPVWGETVNPHDLSRSCGGSSGGEGALISGGGSLLGIGTDIGGSVRLPSSFCGIVGLKPTAQRTSNIGVVPTVPGLVGIAGTAGLMGRDVPIVIEATKAIFSGDEMNILDCDIPPLPWREALFSDQNKKPLRIGWFDYDGLFPVTPGIKRAVGEAASAMKGLGHQLIPFTVPQPLEALKLFMDILNADQGKYLDDHMKDEIVDPTLTWYQASSHIPAQLKSLAQPLLKDRFGDIVSQVSVSTIMSVADLWRRLAQKQEYSRLFLGNWKKLDLDLILCPAFPIPAPKKDPIMISIMTTVGYTCLFNLLDYPAAVVPITKENEEDQQQLKDFVTTDYLHELCKESTLGAQGMPLSVQLVALPYCEEVLCRAMLDLSKAVNFTL